MNAPNSNLRTLTTIAWLAMGLVATYLESAPTTYALDAGPTNVNPNDPLYHDQWYLTQIGAPNAWQRSTGSTNIVVAILDSGVDYNHPDLARNMWSNPGETGMDATGKDKAINGIDDDGNGFVDDVHGADVIAGTGDPMDQANIRPGSPPSYHGTYCAGIIGAEGNNAEGVTGINWAVQLMAVRTAGTGIGGLQGHPDAPFYEHIVAGLDYVLTMKRRGVNIRVVSGSFHTPIPGEALKEVVEALGREGVLCVFAAGNETFNLDLNSTFPHCFNLTNVLVVANTERSGVLNPGSSFGKATVDLAAPGTDILTTTKDGQYKSVTGTSFACPVVAGACALILSAHPELGIEDLKAALFGSVDTSSALTGKVFSNGRLNIGRALEVLAQATAPPIITSALPAGRPTPSHVPLEITFSRPMDRSSVESAFSVTPRVEGQFHWSSDSRSLTYDHVAEFDQSTNYTVRIAATAMDTTGQTLDGNFNRSLQVSPADDFTWTFRFVISNDNVSARIPLIGNSGSLRGNNQYTTWEPFEPQPREPGAQIRGNTVWYSPPLDGGWFTFDLTKGTTFDSIMEVFTAKFGFQNFELLVENDNYGSLQGSRISMEIPRGAFYAIRVSGKDAFAPYGSGPFLLNWYPTPSPGFNGNHFFPAAGAPGAKITISGTNLTGTTAVLFNGVSAAFSSSSGNNLDLRITATVPPNATAGPVTIVTPHGSVTSARSFTVQSPIVSLAIMKVESGYEISWNDTNDLYRLELSMDLINWDAHNGLRGIRGDRTIQSSTFQPENAFFRLQHR